MSGTSVGKRVITEMCCFMNKKILAFLMAIVAFSQISCSEKFPRPEDGSHNAIRTSEFAHDYMKCPIQKRVRPEGKWRIAEGEYCYFYFPSPLKQYSGTVGDPVQLGFIRSSEYVSYMKIGFLDQTPYLEWNLNNLEQEGLGDINVDMQSIGNAGRYLPSSEIIKETIYKLRYIDATYCRKEGEFSNGIYNYQHRDEWIMIDTRYCGRRYITNLTNVSFSIESRKFDVFLQHNRLFVDISEF